MDVDALKDFPKLSNNELCDINLGVYQIKQVKIYVSRWHIPD